MKKDIKAIVKRMPVRTYVTLALIIIGAVVLDQVTKLLAVEYLAPVVDVPIIDGVLHLHFHLNDGAAFGSFSGKPYIFNTMSVLIIVGMSLYLFLGMAETRLSRVSCAFIIAGGIGNMIDRVLFGEVTDFIYFKLIDFAIFNVADSFVCIGAGMLVLSLILELVAESRAAKARKGEKAVEPPTEEEEKK